MPTADVLKIFKIHNVQIYTLPATVATLFQYFKKCTRKSKSKGRILEGLRVSFKYNQSSAVYMTSNMSGQTTMFGQIMLIYVSRHIYMFTCIPV